MSLARAFTKRSRRPGEESPSSTMGRSCTVRYQPGTIRRNMISLPTELISTTNVHALNAPDIRKVSSTSSTESLKSSSGSETDFSTIDKAFLTADNSSVDSSPATPSTPLEGSTRDFFAAKPTPVAADPIPVIPKRAPSHSKRAHVELSRSRSVTTRMSPPPVQITKNTSTRSSADFFSSAATADPNHPFSAELAQVNEIAEEFGGANAMLDEEEQEMMAKGLCKFSANDYLHEIAPLIGGVFEDQLEYGMNPWI